MGKRRKALLLTLVFMLVSVFTLGAASTEAQAAPPKLNKKSIVLVKGYIYNLKMSGTSKKITWSSSKNSVAQVKKTSSKAARVTAKKKGAAYVYAKVGTKKYKCKVKVVEAKMSVTKKNIDKGSSYTLKVKGYAPSKWSSSKTSVATVNSKGKVTAKKVGACVIYAHVGNNKIKCIVSVKNKPQPVETVPPKPPVETEDPKDDVNDDVRLLTTELTIAVGETGTTYLSKGVPSKWESSAPSIATVEYDPEYEEFSINGIGIGACDIRIYVGSKVLNCRVSVESNERPAPDDPCLNTNGIHWNAYGLDKIVYNHQVVDETNLPMMKAALLCEPAVQNFLNNYITPDMIPVEKLMAIEKFLCDNDTRYGPGQPLAMTCPGCPDYGLNYYFGSAHSMLYTHLGKCTAFAKTVEYLCIAMDIPCFYVGNSGGIKGHAWDVVYIDGEWYNLDFTNDWERNFLEDKANSVVLNEIHTAAYGYYRFQVTFGDRLLCDQGFKRYTTGFPERNSELNVAYCRIRTTGDGFEKGQIYRGTKSTGNVLIKENSVVYLLR